MTDRISLEPGQTLRIDGDDEGVLIENVGGVLRLRYVFEGAVSDPVDAAKLDDPTAP